VTGYNKCCNLDKKTTMQHSTENNKLPPIYVVSGGKGLAGNTVVQSILIQFPNNKIPVIVFPNVLNKEKVEEAVKEAHSNGAVIVHTMVAPLARKELIKTCKKYNVRHFDLVGELSDYLSALLKEEPISQPGLFRLRNIEYFQRVDAIEFALKHDDGYNTEKISTADIVLTGVSRTGKTPLSVYLAMFGWKAANVPIIPEMQPPHELFDIDPQRVFGLTTTTRNLITQRNNRVRMLKMSSDNDYINPRKVRAELDYAENIFRKGGFTVFNITNKPIESSANEILTLITDRFGRDKWKKG
jgi:hypothetical protein